MFHPEDSEEKVSPLLVHNAAQNTDGNFLQRLVPRHGSFYAQPQFYAERSTSSLSFSSVFSSSTTAAATSASISMSGI